jgi:hypothetical protein
MATTSYFEETITDQGREISMDVELGTSSYYEKPSLFLSVDEKTVIMDQDTAKRFVKAVIEAGYFYGFVKGSFVFEQS